MSILHLANPQLGGLDLQWWQWLSGVVVILGLSPAPWVTALLRGKLITLSAHTADLEEQERAHKAIIAEKDAALARVVEDKNYWRAAAGNDRERSDAMADKLMTVTEEFGATTVHLLRALPEAVKVDEQST